MNLTSFVQSVNGQRQVSARQPGQMPPTMRQARMGVGFLFAVGQRVVINFIPADPSLIVRGEVVAQATDLAGFPVYSVLLDFGLTVNDVHEEDMTDEGPPTLVAQGTDVDSFQASAAASTVTFTDGDAGQTIIEGLGLGLLASLPLVRDTVANNLIPTGVVVTGIESDGINSFIVNWEVPQPGFAQAYMGIVLAVIVIALAAVGIILALGWSITKVTLLLKGRPAIPGKASIGIGPGNVVPEKIGGGKVVVVDSKGNLVPAGSTCPADGCHTLGTPGVPGTGAITSPFPTGLVIAGVVAVLLINATSRARGL